MADIAPSGPHLPPLARPPAVCHAFSPLIRESRRLRPTRKDRWHISMSLCAAWLQRQETSGSASNWTPRLARCGCSF
ncbi:unnamed protein product [Tetraodon nigroviridis]|uniref:(spotted green pufferfish) hypothetical protein n=1 Tax=Tetraodon nigroviridis TaxID=99883 RepID=Q4STZ0_TETNG|nr:unnamed protein product [Tetraodon nigroviridis]